LDVVSKCFFRNCIERSPFVIIFVSETYSGYEEVKVDIRTMDPILDCFSVPTCSVGTAANFSLRDEFAEILPNGPGNVSQPEDISTGSHSPPEDKTFNSDSQSAEDAAADSDSEPEDEVLGFISKPEDTDSQLEDEAGGDNSQPEAAGLTRYPENSAAGSSSPHKDEDSTADLDSQSEDCSTADGSEDFHADSETDERKFDSGTNNYFVRGFVSAVCTGTVPLIIYRFIEFRHVPFYSIVKHLNGFCLRMEM